LKHIAGICSAVTGNSEAEYITARFVELLNPKPQEEEETAEDIAARIKRQARE
jgi:hypothetical protein